MPKKFRNCAKKLKKKPNNDLSKAMGQLSVTSDETSTPSKNLCDMPVDVVGPIIEKLDYRQQLRLRKVCKSLRALVDQQKPTCKSIKVVHSKKFVSITIDRQFVKYTTDFDDDEIDFEEDFTGKFIRRDDFKKIAFDDLAFTLKNPKLQLEEFSVRFRDPKEKEMEKYYNSIHSILKTLNHPLSVKKVEFTVLTPSCLLSILSCLKSGILKKISLRREDDVVNSGVVSTGMDQVALLEQWEQAEELELWDCFGWFPMKHATHFEKIQICETFISADKLARIKDYLIKLDNFKQCTLFFAALIFYPNSVYELMGTPVSRNSIEMVYHHTIPDSDYYLEIKKSMMSMNFEITRKKR